eukprot:CAMPEP_0198138996 /NCGR_PEP_ID=MMETSP1443-20131203/2342_1 /TAXON_ID=186043 /ORGANISM="Entomoneis sp., Strain CCMP2396" /LENGTH=359 /DNA_ID=CAMNT_0043800963 /DNA_START=88 /DNA_END=1167 /DNA_ORIENTATION=+
MEIQLATFDPDSIQLGDLLGTGGFSSVFSFQIRRKVFQNNSCSFDFKAKLRDIISTTATDLTGTCDSSIFSESSTDSICDDRSSRSDETPDKDELALKTLHDSTLINPVKRNRAARDLRTEVHLLSDLSRHPNIIRLHGVSTDFWMDSDTAFIVLEKLEEPLDKAIRRWKEDLSSSFGMKLLPRKQLSKTSQATRIQKVAVGLACAFKFLHGENIVFRDLKPANVGFDKEGNVKLFDFACARELAPGTRLQQRTGTLRYMSPECARKEFYDLSTDVFSFALLLWEVCALEKPYENIVEKHELNRRIILDEKRPSLNKISSSAIKNLLSKCWSSQPVVRPTFDSIHDDLKTEVAQKLAQR